VEIISNGTVDSKKPFVKVRRDKIIDRAFRVQMIRVVQSKIGKQDTFNWVTTAPVDVDLPWRRCMSPQVCGSTLNAFGYWPNSSCAARAMLLNVPGYAQFDFPVFFDRTWPNIENDLCKYCSAGNEELRTRTGTISPSIAEALKNWKNAGTHGFPKF
jgi:hypothetical protein